MCNKHQLKWNIEASTFLCVLQAIVSISPRSFNGKPVADNSKSKGKVTKSDDVDDLPCLKMKAWDKCRLLSAWY